MQKRKGTKIVWDVEIQKKWKYTDFTSEVGWDILNHNVKSGQTRQVELSDTKTRSFKPQTITNNITFRNYIIE